MGKRRRPLETLEQELETVRIENEIMSHEAEMAEKRAAIAELKKRYGRNWRSVIGISGRATLSDLRQSLTQMNRGLHEQGNVNQRKLSPLTLKHRSSDAGTVNTTKLSPLAPNHLRRR